MPADTSYLQIERASFEPNGRPVFLQRQTASDAADSRVDRGTALPGRAVATAIPHAVRDVISSTGQPLDTGTQHFMESRFGHDFSQVRVHTDAAAAKSARTVNARAYTVGSDVAFASNEFAPETQRGRELLAHELAHTVQQSNADGAPPSPEQQGVFERSADAAAHDVANGRAVTGELPSCRVGLSRSPGPDDERAKAIAEAQALVASSDERLKDDETEDEPVAPRKSKSSPKFLPGGFTDKEVYKEYEEAKERMKLADLAIALAEKQVKRHEFWDTNPSNNTADSRKAFALDLYWDQKEQTFTRQPYVSKQEDIVRATPESKRIYDDYLWNATVNKPEQKGLVRRVLDPPVHFVCKHTNPCSGIIDQMHRDRESGMAEVDVKKNALARLTIETAMFFAPGEGPSGPIDISKGGKPGGGPFETPAFETGTPTALEKPSETANTPRNLESRKLEPTKPPEEGSVASTTTKEEAVPEAVSEEANTERIRPGRVGEIVGDFEIAGDKGMKGDTFERNIYGLSNTRGKQTDIGPVMDLFRNFIKEAKAQGAKNLRITGNVIRNRNVLVMKRIVEKFGGTIRQTGDMSTEINIPID